MITKCSSVILQRRKFSQFVDADPLDNTLSIVGVQEMDGELENVKINVKELLDAYMASGVIHPVIDNLNPDCPYFIEGDSSAINIFSCGGCAKKIVSFDYNKTGDYIQIDNVSADIWDLSETEAHIHITFENLPIGKTINVLLKNCFVGVPSDKDAFVVLHSIGPDEKIRLYDNQICPFCCGEQKLYKISLGDKTGDIILQFIGTRDTDNDEPVRATRFLNPPTKSTL